MRQIIVSQECENFINKSSNRVQTKFDYLLAIIAEHEIVSKNFVDKLTGSVFYELKIKADNQIRVIIFTIDNSNFQLAERVVLLNGFVKKSTKDYKKAVSEASKLLGYYKNEL